MWRKLRSIESRSDMKLISSASTVTVPDSILERSGMSVIRFSKSEPDEWMLRANSTCFGVRFPALFLARELTRLGAELFVRLLQFLLLRLQFDRELLRLLQQTFRTHRRLDRVQHD